MSDVPLADADPRFDPPARRRRYSVRNPARLTILAGEPHPEVLMATPDRPVLLDFECRSQIGRLPKTAALVRLTAIMPADRGRDLAAAWREALRLTAPLTPQFATLIRRGEAPVVFDQPRLIAGSAQRLVRARLTVRKTVNDVILDGLAAIDLRCDAEDSPTRLPPDRAAALADRVQVVSTVVLASLDGGFNSHAFEWSDQNAAA